MQESGFAAGVEVVRVNAQPKLSSSTKQRSGRVSKPERPVFEYWDLPSNAASLESPPTTISDLNRSRLNNVLTEGSKPKATDGEDLFIVLGLDFGTSSTKVVVRLPYETGEPAIAIPAPGPCCSDQDPYLWQTVLWLRDEDIFSPWPEPGAEVVKSLKHGLIQGQRNVAGSGTGEVVSVKSEVAAAAYLAYVVQYVKGWLQSNRRELFRQRRPRWLLNLGLPAASYDDLELAELYRRIGSAGLLLSDIGTPVSVEAAEKFLEDQHVVESGASKEAAEELGVAVIPEAAAEMTAFAKSVRGAPGLYLLVDVGAMTLDACMFRLNQHTGSGDAYSFMAAQVRPLGVDSLHWFLAEGKTKPEFIRQCERALRAVVWNTKRVRDPAAANWKPGNDVPIFLAGGGASNPLHKEIVDSLGPWLKQHTRNDGIRPLKIPVPKGIELPEPLENFGRMAVAWGLSYPSPDIGRIEPMRDIEDIPPPARKPPGRFTSKDDM